VLGLSQGGLLARYIVEQCPTKATVRNMVTLGGPHKGVAAIPNCGYAGVLCEMIDFVADNLVYFNIVQDFCGPAGYFRDPRDLDKYLADSVFLPYVNNEKEID